MKKTGSLVRELGDPRQLEVARQARSGDMLETERAERKLKVSKKVEWLGGRDCVARSRKTQ